MDPFAVLGKQVVEQALDDVGHSALPDAPVQPYRPPRRWRLVVRRWSRSRAQLPVRRRRGRRRRRREAATVT